MAGFRALGNILEAAGENAGFWPPRRRAAIEGAYYPWIGSLNTMLESLVDYDDDMGTGNHSYISDYRAREDVVHRLQRIAAAAIGAAREPPHGRGHARIVTAMVAFYLSDPAAERSDVRTTGESIVPTIGPCLRPLVQILHAQRRLL